MLAYWAPRHFCIWTKTALSSSKGSCEGQTANELTHGKESFGPLVCTEAKPRGFILCCLPRKVTDRGFPRDFCSHCLLQIVPGATP